MINTYPIIRRHVVLPKTLVKESSRNKLLTEAEWRALGVQQSRGWVHFMLHEPGKVAYVYTLE